MAKTVEIILGYVDKPVAMGAAGTSLIDQYNSDKKGFVLVNQSAQTAAAVANVTSIVKLTAGFTPFLNIKTNMLAATTVFLKITAEYKKDGTFNTGDVLSLIGNVAGIVGSVMVLAGTPHSSVVLVGIGVGTGVASIVTSDVARKLYASLVKPLWEKHFRARPKAVYPNYWVAPDLKLVSLAQIGKHYAHRIAASKWHPATNAIVLTGEKHDRFAAPRLNRGGSQGGGEHVGIMIFPLPEPPSWRIDIGPIEIVPPHHSSFNFDRYH